MFKSHNLQIKSCLLSFVYSSINITIEYINCGLLLRLRLPVFSLKCECVLKWKASLIHPFCWCNHISASDHQPTLTAWDSRSYFSPEIVSVCVFWSDQQQQAAAAHHAVHLHFAKRREVKSRYGKSYQTKSSDQSADQRRRQRRQQRLKHTTKGANAHREKDGDSDAGTRMRRRRWWWDQISKRGAGKCTHNAKSNEKKRCRNWWDLLFVAIHLLHYIHTWVSHLSMYCLLLRGREEKWLKQVSSGKHSSFGRIFSHLFSPFISSHHFCEGCFFFF